ncbi:proteasome subunit alpha [Tsukamurella pulmonis]|uniref:proteasome subunit alpha n=1 Tax=Tsukamurella pulmonis TaxID=47312 RepID=UPI00079CB72D|nr:proteasome subunit alpha [Tsukamurella pulmonis]KXP09391.1 proteasome subunit alpha [Tsukamurella pulmonis]RDH09250.1 proteasome subunit alpha [Tsukamurella pulmonis]BDD82656.1 proteasome subunit alpha [Tsukamurella pulmonis]
MTFPYYASAEQIMRDRSDLARKGIARGRSVVVLKYADGVLFVADNPSSLYKISEIYDRIGFAAVGKYNEFESLRRAGIQFADTRGYQYSRRDVSGWSLTNAYASTLGTVFTEQAKPYEVELCVAEVGTPDNAASRLYRVGYDGSVIDEKQFVVMGGQTESTTPVLTEGYEDGMDLAAAFGLAVRALGAPAPSNGASGAAETKSYAAGELEVAVLDHTRPRRAFKRLTDERVGQLLA